MAIKLFVQRDCKNLDFNGEFRYEIAAVYRKTDGF
jgi:hypothetical protein